MIIFEEENPDFHFALDAPSTPAPPDYWWEKRGQGSWALRLQGGGGWPAEQGRLELPLVFLPWPHEYGAGTSSESEERTLGRRGPLLRPGLVLGSVGTARPRELAVWSWGPAGGEEAVRTERQNTPALLQRPVSGSSGG